MEAIKLVDLNNQYAKIKDEIDEAIFGVLNSTEFINGTEVSRFQKNLEKYLNINHVIPCANGTDALQIALMSLNLKQGDEVITPTFTFISTAEVIALLGLKPIFVDVDANSFNIDCSNIEKYITPKTKAIIPVHLFGQVANMECIMQLASKYNLYVIEDTAQALGADYVFSNGTKQKAGTIGHIGCTSFFPSKCLGGFGDGGAIFTQNNELAEKMRCIANHGMKVRYYHEQIGINSRLDSIQAAILRIKLKYLDQYLDARIKAAIYYDNVFKNIPMLQIPTRSTFSTHIFHQYTLKVKNNLRDKLKEYLQQQAIPTAIYYPVPLHLQKAFSFTGYQKGMLPVSEQLSEMVISLPMHTELSDEQLQFITNHVVKFFNQ